MAIFHSYVKLPEAIPLHLKRTSLPPKYVQWIRVSVTCKFFHVHFWFDYDSDILIYGGWPPKKSPTLDCQSTFCSFPKLPFWEPNSQSYSQRIPSWIINHSSPNQKLIHFPICLIKTYQNRIYIYICAYQQLLVSTCHSCTWILWKLAPGTLCAGPGVWSEHMEANEPATTSKIQMMCWCHPQKSRDKNYDSEDDADEGWRMNQ